MDNSSYPHQRRNPRINIKALAQSTYDLPGWPILSFGLYGGRSQENLLVQVDGQSHVVHSEPEALGTRLTIDSLTCLLANETDPSRLITVSPGKLIRKFFDDGAHIDKDQPYAEIEVRPAFVQV